MGEGGEFIPISSLERNFTVGKEVSIQKKVEGVSQRAIALDIFDDFETQERRKAQLDEIVRYASTNDVGEVAFDSYETLIDRSCSNRDQTQINETFDVLRRGFSLAINSDQRTQTSLNVGGLGEILPDAAKYNNGGVAKLNLAEGILEVTITNPKIREVFRRGSEIIEKSDRSTVEGKRKAAREMESLNSQLENIEPEAKAGGFESEWNEGRAYFDTATGTLYGEMGSKDGSVDKVDEAAIVGRLSAAAEKMAEAAEKLLKTSEKVDVSGQSGAKRERRGSRDEVDAEAIMKKHLAGVDKISSAIEDPNAMLKSFGMEELPDELVGKLREGVSLRDEEIEGLDDAAVKAAVIGHKSELEQWMRFNRAKNAALTEILKAQKKDSGSEVDNVTPMNLDYLYECLDYIENGGFKSDDLTRNSHTLAVLYAVKMGYYTNIVITKMENGQNVVKDRLDEKQLESFQKEIGNRLFLHDAYLAMSKCHSIEDYVRTLMALSEGDIGSGEESGIRGLVSTILSRTEKDGKRFGMGYKQIPVDMAWDLRQIGNYRIAGLGVEISKADWFIEKIKNGDIEEKLLKQIVDWVTKDSRRGDVEKHIKGFRQYRGGEWDKLNYKKEDPVYESFINEVKKGKDMGVDVWRFALADFLWPEVELEADEQMRLNNPVYKNFWLMERDGLRQYGIIREYMLQKMQYHRFNGEEYKTDESKKEARKRVEKAFDLARKASVAFADNRADIKYSGNEYSPLLNAHFSRIADNRQVVVRDHETGEALVKSKFAGAVDNIPFIWAFTPYWLEFAKKDSAGIHTPYDPLLIDDIDFSKISRGNDMLFQFTQIISTQSFPVSESFTNLENLSPQKLRKPGAFESVYAKINKLVAKGFAPARVYCTTYVGDDLYNGWKPNEAGVIDKVKSQTSAYRVAERMREYYVDDVFGVMKDADATYEDFVMIRDALKWSGRMSHQDKKGRIVAGGYFIKPKRVDYWAKMTGVESRVKNRDATLKKLAHMRWGGGK